MLFSSKGKQGVLGRASGSRPIAVDFGTRALKVLQVGPGDPPALVAAARLPTPDQLLFNTSKRLDFQLQELPKLIERGGFKGRRVACLIPSSSTFCKHMQVALGEGVNAQAVLESAIPAELNCPSDALVIRSHEVALAPKNAERQNRAYLHGDSQRAGPQVHGEHHLCETRGCWIASGVACAAAGFLRRWHRRI